MTIVTSFISCSSVGADHGYCSRLDNDQTLQEYLSSTSQRDPKTPQPFFDDSFDMETNKGPKSSSKRDLRIRLNGRRTRGFRCRGVSCGHG